MVFLIAQNKILCSTQQSFSTLREEITHAQVNHKKCVNSGCVLVWLIGPTKYVSSKKLVNQNKWGSRKGIFSKNAPWCGIVNFK